MAIGGKTRLENNFEGKKVGLFSSNVIAVNPDREQYKELLGMDLGDESRADVYLGESKEGNTSLRVSFWLEEVKTKQKFNVTFFLENKEKTNKDNTKKQYINTLGSCSWSDDPNNLPDWFKKREYRVAFVGEEDLYNFMRTWLGKLDYKDADAVLDLEWKKLMKGDVKLIRSLIGGDLATEVVALATVKTVEKEGETKEYQAVYNKAFLPSFALKQFRVVDYNKPEEQAKLKTKKSSDLKPHERFVLNCIGDYGVKDFYKFCDLKEYDPADNLVASNEPISTDGADY